MFIFVTCMVRQVLLFIFILNCFSQTPDAYYFLSLPASPMVAGLGGLNVSISDKDLASAYYNPALLDSNHKNLIELNFVDYFAGIVYGYTSYAFQIIPNSYMYGAIKYLNYGKFIYADEFGNKLGTFTGDNTMIIIGANRLYDNLRIGMNIKFFYSQLNGFYASGLVSDLGLYYYYPQWDISAAITLNNFGTDIKSYSNNLGIKGMPFEINAGVTKKIPHAPFRVSLTFQQLQQPKLTYPEQKQKTILDLTGTTQEETKNSLGENIIRHIIIGTEVILSKNFNLRVGYNFRRRRELKPPEKPFTFAGMSFGVTLKIKGYQISYSYSNFYAVGGMNTFGISRNLKDFIKK